MRKQRELRAFQHTQRNTHNATYNATHNATHTTQHTAGQQRNTRNGCRLPFLCCLFSVPAGSEQKANNSASEGKAEREEKGCEHSFRNRSIMLEAVTEACWSPILALPARALARIEVGLRGSTELRELRTFLRCWLPFLSLSAVSKRRRTRGEQQRQRTKGGGRRKRHPAPWKTQRGAVYREGGDRNAVALERAGTSRCTRDDHGKAVHFQSSDCKMDLRFVQYFVCTNKYTRRAASSAPSSNLECCCSCKYMWTIVQHDGPKHLEMWCFVCTNKCARRSAGPVTPS